MTKSNVCKREAEGEPLHLGDQGFDGGMDATETLRTHLRFALRCAPSALVTTAIELVRVGRALNLIRNHRKPALL